MSEKVQDIISVVIITISMIIGLTIIFKMEPVTAAETIVLHSKDTVFISGGIEPGSALKLVKDFEEIQYAPNKVINVVINTPGGSFRESIAMAAFLFERQKTHKLNIISIYAASGGFIIHQLGGGVLGTPNSTYMWHMMSYYNMSGKATDMLLKLQQDLQLWSMITQEMNKLNTMSQAAFFTNTAAEKDYTAAEALQFGIIDRIVNIKCEPGFFSCELQTQALK